MSKTITYIHNNSVEKEDKRMSHFVGIGLVLAFLLPHSSTALLLVNPLLCVFYQFFKQNRSFYKYNWIVLVPIIIALLINLPQGVSSKSVMSCISILLYFFCFPIVGRVKIPNAYFYFVMIFILATQLAFAFNLTFFEDILNTYYPLSEQDKAGQYSQNSVNASNILDYRLGGLYHNPNQCARYLTFILAAFIILNSEKPFKKLVPFIMINYSAVILTGSRTGFVVASLIIIAYIFVDKRITSLWKTFVVLIAVVAFIVVALTGSDTFRGFNIIEGFGGSANLKMDTFAYYLSSENSIIKLLLGYLDPSRFDHSGSILYVMNSFDSDYGGIIFSFGFIGFVAILIYYFSILLKLSKNGRVFFILLLWMYSSTIVTSYRALFIFMLLLSVIYNSEKEEFIKSNHS